MRPTDDARPSDAVETMLTEYGEATRALARAVRALVHTLDPGVVEVPWPKQGVIGFGIGPRKYTEHYAYLALHRAHVNLGFNQGAELADPAGLLTGPGKSLRHHRLARLDDVREPALTELLVQARRHRATTTHASAGSRP